MKPEMKQEKKSIENVTNRMFHKNGKVIVRCICRIRGGAAAEEGSDSWMLHYAPSKCTPVHFFFSKGIPYRHGIYWNIYQFEIPVEDVLKLDIQNRLKISHGASNPRVIRFFYRDGKKGKYKNSNLVFLQDQAVYLRQSDQNNVYLTVRPKNDFDSFAGRCKVFLGYMLSKILPDQNDILMYEKDGRKYEESASVLFEKLIDEGYSQVSFVLEKDHPALSGMPMSYQKHILIRHSLRHIIRFFQCRNFIATETIAHALQLRAANRLIIRKNHEKKIRFVFLQHGVSYMVSLNAAARNGFRPEGLDLYRVTVSSELEKKHFTELAGLDPEEVYVTGMAKFDRCTSQENADRIVIMPTWRRWEVNQASRDFTATGYYRMLERILQAIPKHLQEKVIVLPHPLMQDAILKNAGPVKKYLEPEKTHDEILKSCRVLITDYSSIAYDAFYRGANVIFYWEEKDACISQYGGAHLMLNEENVFGDICYDPEELTECITHNYEAPQEERYRQRYQQIVAFHDGNNTERIIAALKKDGIL